MAIWVAGIDHNRANLDVRSLFSLTKRKMEAIYERIRKEENIAGCILISTCNRMEIWLSTDDEKEASPVEVLCRYLELDTKVFECFFIVLKQEEAVKHLFRVAAGLESQIIGEDQIITQVGDALAFARSCDATDHALEVLFRLAVTAGKRVKTEIDLSTADSSVIHHALHQLEEEGISVRGQKCMVIGNGMMGKLSAQTLMEFGADVTVTIRQYHSGYVETPPGAKRILYESRLSLLPECTFVVSATSSPNYTLKREDLEQLDIGHRIYMIDLAVPRDIEQSVGELPWSVLYDMDSFRIDRKSEKFLKNLEKAEKILAEEEKEFDEWYNGKDIVPRIQRLKSAAGADVSLRLNGFLRKSGMEETEKKKLHTEVESASSRMMNRLLFGMRERLPEKEYLDCLKAMEEVIISEKSINL